MRTILPGAVIGLLGAGENSRMFAAVAERMGYRVQPSASGADVVTVASDDVLLIHLHSAATLCPVRPGVKVFEAIENGIGTKRDPSVAVVADFAIVAARGVDGAFAYYPPIAIDRIGSDQIRGVPDVARMPAPIDSRTIKRAAIMVRDIFEETELIGVACVEFTLTHESQLVVHELTPYPHLAGYLTIKSCVTDQFEQQLRAVCGLPLGSTDMLTPSAMAVINTSEGQPDFAAALALPGVTFYKDHLIATAASATLAKQIVRAACNSLRTA